MRAWQLPRSDERPGDSDGSMEAERDGAGEMRGANEDERLPRTSVVRATVGRGGAFRRVQNGGGGGGGGGRGFSYSPDTVEGLRLPAVKLDAHHSSLDRIVRGGEDVGARGMVCTYKYTHMACMTHVAFITHMWHV